MAPTILSKKGILTVMTKIYVAIRDTKNYTVYQDEKHPEEKLNMLYLPKGLPAKVQVTITEVPA